MSPRIRIALLIAFLCAQSMTVANATNLDDEAKASVPPETLATVEKSKQFFAAALRAKGRQRLSGLRQAYQKLEEAASENEMLAPPRTMWAKMLLSVGDTKGAMAALQQAVLESPDDPEAYVMLAKDAVRDGRLVEADLSFAAALQRTERLPENHLRRNALFAQIESGEAAIALARSSLASQVNRPELADAYQESALNHLKNWVAAAPNNSNAHDQLATALLKRGETTAAIESFEKARALDESLPVTELRLARASIAKGQSEAAMKSLRDAIKRYPKDVNVQAVAADLFLVMGDVPAAESQIAATLELNPNDLRTKRLEAQLLRLSGQWARAAEKLQKLSSEHPTDFETSNLLAQTLSELADDESRKRAVSVATVISQRFDSDTLQGRRARITLIWAAFSSDQKKLAKAALEQLLKVGIDSRQISGDESYFLSRLLVEFGRPEIASTILSGVLARKGAFPKRAAAEELAVQLK